MPGDEVTVTQSLRCSPNRAGLLPWSRTDDALVSPALRQEFLHPRSAMWQHVRGGLRVGTPGDEVTVTQSLRCFPNRAGFPLSQTDDASGSLVFHPKLRHLRYVPSRGHAPAALRVWTPCGEGKVTQSLLCCPGTMQSRAAAGCRKRWLKQIQHGACLRHHSWEMSSGWGSRSGEQARQFVHSWLGVWETLTLPRGYLGDWKAEWRQGTNRVT